MRTCLCLIFFIFSFSAAHATSAPDSIPASTWDSQLTDNGNGTISDKKTSLMWKKCVEGVSGNACDIGTPITFNWQQAMEQPGVINSCSGFAGYHDWRLPNIKELTSIVEEQCSYPVINLNRFPNTTSSIVWSGSPNATYWNGSWYVYFDYGYSTYHNRSNTLQMRLVRSGK